MSSAVNEGRKVWCLLAPRGVDDVSISMLSLRLSRADKHRRGSYGKEKRRRADTRRSGPHNGVQRGYNRFLGQGWGPPAHRKDCTDDRGRPKGVAITWCLRAAPTQPSPRRRHAAGARNGCRVAGRPQASLCSFELPRGIGHREELLRGHSAYENGSRSSASARAFVTKAWRVSGVCFVCVAGLLISDNFQSDFF